MFKIPKYKQGQQGIDLIIVVIFVVIFAVMALLSRHLLTEFNSATDNTVLDTPTGSTVIADGSRAINYLDNLLVFFIIGMTFALAISAYFIETHPAFFMISLVVWILTVVLAFQFQNIFEQVSSNVLLSGDVVELPLLAMIFSKFGLIVAAMGLVVIVVLFGKRSTSI